MSGSTIALLEPIAIGSLGVSWRAREPGKRGRLVTATALPEGADDPLVGAQQGRVEAMAGFRHPFVLNPRDIQALDGVPHLIEDHADGVDLGVLLQRQRLDKGAAVEVVRKVARALHATYDRVPKGKNKKARGLVHGALSPQAVVVEVDGKVKLQGLGVVPTDAGGPAVHPLFQAASAWSAPEAMDGASSHAADTYALGATLFQALTGTVPPYASTQQDWHEAVVAAAVQKVLEATEVDALGSLLGQMLAFDPTQRPLARDVEKLAERLLSTVSDPETSPDAWLAGAVSEVVLKHRAELKEFVGVPADRPAAGGGLVGPRFGKGGAASSTQLPPEASENTDSNEVTDPASDDIEEPPTVRMDPSAPRLLDERINPPSTPPVVRPSADDAPGTDTHAATGAGAAAVRDAVEAASDADALIEPEIIEPISVVKPAAGHERTVVPEPVEPGLHHPEGVSDADEGALLDMPSGSEGPRGAVQSPQPRTPGARSPDDAGNDDDGVLEMPDASGRTTDPGAPPVATKSDSPGQDGLFDGYVRPPTPKAGEAQAPAAPSPAASPETSSGGAYAKPTGAPEGAVYADSDREPANTGWILGAVAVAVVLLAALWWVRSTGPEPVAIQDQGIATVTPPPAVPAAPPAAAAPEVAAPEAAVPEAVAPEAAVAAPEAVAAAPASAAPEPAPSASQRAPAATAPSTASPAATARPAATPAATATPRTTARPAGTTSPASASTSAATATPSTASTARSPSTSTPAATSAPATTPGATTERVEGATVVTRRTPIDAAPATTPASVEETPAAAAATAPATAAETPAAETPAATGGKLTVVGDAVSVELVGAAGRFSSGSLPVGGYDIKVVFEDGGVQQDAGRVQVTDGRQVTVTCKKSFMRCTVR